MKTKFTLILIFAASTFIPMRNTMATMSPAKSNTVLMVEKDDVEIARIRAEYKRINQARLKAEKFRFGPMDCLEEGEVTYFMEGKNIVKIKEKIISGDGYAITEYYYQGGAFIFAYEEVSGGPAAGSETITKRRFYAKSDKGLRQMENEQIVNLDVSFDEVLKVAKALPSTHVSKDFKKLYCD